MIWTSVPPPESRSATIPAERNTNACSATATVQPRNASRSASSSGPPPNGPLLGGRLAVTALITASTEPSSVARVRERATQSSAIGRVGLDRHRAALANARERVLAAGDGGGVPAVREEMIDDRAAEIAGAENDDCLWHPRLIPLGRPALATAAQAAAREHTPGGFRGCVSADRGV